MKTIQRVGVLMMIAFLSAFCLRQYTDHLSSVYALLQHQSNSNYIIMDTLVRLFHHTGQHKEPIDFCPECFKQRVTSDDPVVIITRDEYNRLLQK